MLGQYEAGMVKGKKEDEECKEKSASLQHEYTRGGQTPNSSVPIDVTAHTSITSGCSFCM